MESSVVVRDGSMRSPGGFVPLADWTGDGGSPPLDEILTELDDALYAEPERLRQLVAALDHAIAVHVSSMSTAEPYVDAAFCSAKYQRRLDRIRQRYFAVAEECVRLHEAEMLDPLAVARLTRRAARLQEEESDLILEALWTDTGSLD